MACWPGSRAIRLTRASRGCRYKTSAHAHALESGAGTALTTRALQVQDGKLVSANGGKPFKNVFDALARTARSEGLLGLYRGFGVAFIGSAPASCLYFTSYEVRDLSVSSHVRATCRSPGCPGIQATV